MDIYQCDACGVEVKNTQPEKCPLCSGSEFSKLTGKDPTASDKKEHDLLDATIAELDKYDEGTEHRDPSYAYRCSCSAHSNKKRRSKTSKSKTPSRRKRKV